MTKSVTYEQPLNERIRMFLRLDYLITHYKTSLNGKSAWHAHNAIITLLEIIDLISRGDIKSELMKELKRQVANIEHLTRSPNVDGKKLETIISNHKQLIDSLHDISGQPAALLRKNDFINSIKQRASIPGGTCDFDLPAYHHWLTRSHEQRHKTLSDWIDPFIQIHNVIKVVITLVRESSTLQQAEATRGFYEQALVSDQPNQLIRVRLPADSVFYPEISAGKQRFTIRFFEHADMNQRPSQASDDITFEITVCAL